MDAVLNWLWQGGVVASVAAVALRLLNGCRAGVRLAVCWAALALILLLPALSVLSVPASTSPLEAASPSAPLVSIPQRWWSSSAVAVAAWVIWSGVHVTRLGAALVALRRAKRSCRPVPPERQARLPHWRRLRTGGRRAQLATCTTVRAAAVLGGRSPVIALAPALLEHLSDVALDRIVIHEWAHVQRRDDWIHFGQLAVRACAGWHPAVWWIDRRLGIEREIACDELTVAISGSPKAYAASLASVAALPALGSTALPLVGALSSPALARRIHRILFRREFTSDAWSRSAAAACVIALGGAAIAVGAVRAVAISRTSLDEDAQHQLRDVPLTGAPQWNAAAAAVPPLAAAKSQPVWARNVREEVREMATSSSSLRSAAPHSAASADQVPGAAPANGLAAPSWLPSLAAGNGSLEARWAAHPSAVPRTTAAAGPESTPASDDARSAWESIARAGVTVGQESKEAGVATASFFSRMGKRIAGSF